MGNCYYDANVRFVQTEYGRQPTFSSFLPGIAGPWGIPTWCNYNNRGQAVCSFGVQDKDHAILEFTAAAAAYQRTPLTGFRTFLKENGKVTEAFADGLGTMTVEPNVLTISWRDSLFAIEVTYFSLPNERMAGLCRRVLLKNISPKAVETELLDGLAAMVPVWNLRRKAETGTAAEHRLDAGRGSGRKPALLPCPSQYGRYSEGHCCPGRKFQAGICRRWTAA